MTAAYPISLHPQSVDLLAQHIDYCKPERWMHSPPIQKLHYFHVVCTRKDNGFEVFSGNVTTAANAQELGRYYQRRAAECGCGQTSITIVQWW